jgi:hypothetical protein
MKAAVLHGAGEIRTENVPDPVLEAHGIMGLLPNEWVKMSPKSFKTPVQQGV